jgi:hypothetical protein
MITVWNGHRNNLHLSASAHPGDEQPPQSGKMIDWQTSSVKRQLLPVSSDWKRIPFLTNHAGMLLKTKDRCGKLGSEAGMCMKTKVLSPIKRECC